MNPLSFPGLHSLSATHISFRFLVLPFLLLLTSGLKPANESLQVNITWLRSNRGDVLVSLFSSSSGFPGNPSVAFRKVKLPITNRTATVSFSDIPAGTYAVAILHDENNDQKMNSNFLAYLRKVMVFPIM